MITTDRLLAILDDWSLWMHTSNHKLSYPSKSLGMVSGGESTTDAFEDMCSAQDMTNVRTLDAIIHSLPKEQQDALYCRYLKARKPLAYEYKLEMAMDNLLTIAGKRINA